MPENSPLFPLLILFELLFGIGYNQLEVGTHMDFPQFTDEELDEKLMRLFVGHQGSDRAIKRWDLVVEIYGFGSDHPSNDTNLQDRMIRRSVERLRGHGWLILDMNDGRGRFLCRDQEEYWKFRSRYLKPLRARANTIKLMDKTAQETFPNLLQPSLFDMSEFRSVLNEE